MQKKERQYSEAPFWERRRTMYEDGAAVLQMKHAFLKTEKYNRKKYMTRIKTYDPVSEEMTLYTSRGDVDEFSLDAVYECIFEVKEGRFGCEGVIRKRFRSQEKDQVVFRIQNGFYKV